MGFGAEMKDFIDAARGMAGARLTSAQRRKIDWEMEEPPNTGGSAFDNPVGGGISTTSAPDGGKTGAGDNKGDTTLRDATLANRAGGSFVQQAYDYYRNKGLSHAAAAGIAGNLMQESGGDWRVFRGQRAGDQGASHFAAQWNGQRLRNLRKWAGGEPTLQQQLDFVLEEMNPDSPYADQQAAAARDAIFGARSVEEATSLFRQHFERPSANDLASRIKWANQAADNGNYAAGAALVSSGDAGAIPDDRARGGSEPAVAPSEDDGTGQDLGSDVAIEVVPAPDAAPVEAVQVQTDPDPLNVNMASGGAIPDYGAMRYDAGGTAYMNKYAAAKALQPQKTTYANPDYKTASGSVPHKINIPARTNWKAWGDNSPTQKKWRTAQAATKIPEPVKDPVQNKAPTGPRPFGAHMFGSPQGGNSGGGRGGAGGRNSAALPQGAQWTDARRGIMTMNGSQYMLDARARQWVPVGTQMNPVYHGSYTGYQWSGAQQPQGQPVRTGMFAKGGKVSDDDAAFKEWERRYSRPGGGGSAGESPRDRAARTMNIRTRGVNSTAWPPPGSGGGGGQPRRAAPSTGAGKSAASPPVPIPVPRPTPRPEHTEFPPDLAVSPHRPGENRIGNPGVTGGDVSADQPPARSPIVRINKGGGQDAEGNQIFITVPPLVEDLGPDIDTPTGNAEEILRANPRYPNVLGFEKGGAIPGDDGYDNTKWRRDKSKGTFFQTLAKPGKTTKGGGAPETKSSKKVRKASPGRNAKKRKPRTGGGDSNVPIPTPRPETTVRHPPNPTVGTPPSVRHPPNPQVGTPPPTVRHPPNPTVGAPLSVRHPPNPQVGRPPGPRHPPNPTVGTPEPTGAPGIPGYGALGSTEELGRQLDKLLRTMLPNEMVQSGYDVHIVPKASAGHPPNPQVGQPEEPEATGAPGIPGYGILGDLFARGGAIPDEV